jgi:hypothetical protein
MSINYSFFTPLASKQIEKLQVIDGQLQAFQAERVLRWLALVKLREFRSILPRLQPFPQV